MLTYLLFALGFPLLIGGAHYLVEGSAAIARKMKISDIVVGLTIVSLGTSAPELVISILASFSGSNDLAMGNIIGSNISNTLLIIGTAAVIRPLLIKRNTLYKEIPFMLVATLILGVLVNDRFFGGTGSDHAGLGRGDGLVLLGFFVLFSYYVFSIARQGNNDVSLDTPPDRSLSWTLSLLMIFGGVVSLTFGGDWIVDGAVLLARQAGLSEAMIGLTILAVGSSLPELAAAIMAARKGNSDIAIGNVVGSNIVNIFWILGLASVISPIGFHPMLNTDLLLLCGVTVALFVVTFVGHRRRIGRFEGALGLAAYLAYVVFIVLRG